MNDIVYEVNRQFGAGSLIRMDAQPAKVEVIPTGVEALNEALGIGGWPKGRIVEVYGPEAGGKTTVALLAIAQCQAAGGTAAFIDAEHALDPRWAQALGVDLSRLLISQPDNGEQALDIVEALARSGVCSLVVVDSVAALVPRDELEGTMQDSGAGLQARMMSKAMRKLCSPAARTNCTLLFTNQLRQKVGVTFGPSETTTGGNALKYYASVRVDLRRIGRTGGGEGAPIFRAKTVKNKLAPPFGQGSFSIAGLAGGVVIRTVVDAEEAR